MLAQAAGYAIHLQPDIWLDVHAFQKKLEISRGPAKIKTGRIPRFGICALLLAPIGAGVRSQQEGGDKPALIG